MDVIQARGHRQTERRSFLSFSLLSLAFLLVCLVINGRSVDEAADGGLSPTTRTGKVQAEASIGKMGEDLQSPSRNLNDKDQPPQEDAPQEDGEETLEQEQLNIVLFYADGKSK